MGLDDLMANSMYGATVKFIRGLLPNIVYKSKYCFYYLRYDLTSSKVPMRTRHKKAAMNNKGRIAKRVIFWSKALAQITPGLVRGNPIVHVVRITSLPPWVFEVIYPKHACVHQCMNEFNPRTMIVHWSRPRAYSQSGSWTLKYYLLVCSAEALVGDYTVHLADRGKDTCKSKFQCGESKIRRIKPRNLFGTIIPSTLGPTSLSSSLSTPLSNARCHFLYDRLPLHHSPYRIGRQVARQESGSSLELRRLYPASSSRVPGLRIRFDQVR